MNRIVVWTACAALLLSAGATDAAAQMSMGAFRGHLTGQVGAAAGDDVSDPVFMAGIAVSVQEDDGWGAELDFGIANDLDAEGLELDLATYMINANWIQPAGKVRPFGAAGAGVMQIDGCTAPCTRAATTYDLGLNAGGGVLVALHDALAVRGDARYFWSSADHADLGRADNFGFWRVSVGVTWLWVIAP
jgi:hypothetical protein